MNASLMVQTLVDSLSGGAIYILMAVGFTVVFGIMRIINFAHGAAYLLGAYAMYILATESGLPLPAAMVLTVLLLVVLGTVIEITLIERVVDDGVKTLILTLGIAIVVDGAVQVKYGYSPVAVPSIGQGAWHIGGISIPIDQVAIVIIAAVVLAGLWLFLKRASWGQALRAVSQDRVMAAVHGVPVRRVQALGFGAAAGLAALAGALIAGVSYSNPSIGNSALVEAFMVVIIGGLGNIPGTVLAGLLIAVVENVTAIWINPSVTSIASFGVVILVLMITPNGLLGRSSARV